MVPARGQTHGDVPAMVLARGQTHGDVLAKEVECMRPEGSFCIPPRKNLNLRRRLWNSKI